MMVLVRLYIKVLLVIFISGPICHAAAKNNSDSDQLDEQDRQEFNVRIDRANACTQSRDFACAELQLGQAKSYANGSRDRGVLKKSMESLELQRQLAIRDDAKRKYSGERSAVEANADNTEKELAQSRRTDIENGRAESRRADAAREHQRTEDRQSTREYNAAIGAQIRQNINQNTAILGNIDRQTNAAYAETNRVLTAQAAERDRTRTEKAEQEADRRRAADSDRIASAVAQRAADTRLAKENTRIRQQEQDRLQKQVGLEEQARLQEQERQQEQERKKEKILKKVEEDKSKLAEQQVEKQARTQYLQSVTAGTRLVATKCPDGEGKYYATGTRPKIKPEVVGCVDVRFRSYCPGSLQYSEGIAHNFIGMAGCFGDTYDISPKPGCKVDQVRIEVVEVRGCVN